MARAERGIRRLQMSGEADPNLDAQVAAGALVAMTTTHRDPLAGQPRHAPGRRDRHAGDDLGPWHREEVATDDANHN